LSRARLYLWSPIDQHFIFLSCWFFFRLGPRGARPNENDTAGEIGREHSNQLEINTEVIRTSNRALLRRRHFASRRSFCKANVYLFHAGQHRKTTMHARARRNSAAEVINWSVIFFTATMPLETDSINAWLASLFVR